MVEVYFFIIFFHDDIRRNSNTVIAFALCSLIGGNRQGNCSAVWQFKRILHDSLSKRLLADDLCLSEVFQRSGKQFRCTSSISIDQYHHRQVQFVCIGMHQNFCCSVLIGCRCNISSRKQWVYNLFKGSNQSAAIFPNVKHQSFCTLFQQLIQCILELFHGIFFKRGNANISDFIFQHRSISRCDLHFLPLNRLFQFGFSTLNRQFYAGICLSTHMTDCLLIAQIGNRFSVHSCNNVVRL